MGLVAEIFDEIKQEKTSQGAGAPAPAPAAAAAAAAPRKRGPKKYSEMTPEELEIAKERVAKMQEKAKLTRKYKKLLKEQYEDPLLAEARKLAAEHIKSKRIPLPLARKQPALSVLSRQDDEEQAEKEEPSVSISVKKTEAANTKVEEKVEQTATKAAHNKVPEVPKLLIPSNPSPASWRYTPGTKLW